MNCVEFIFKGSQGKRKMTTNSILQLWWVF